MKFSDKAVSAALLGLFVITGLSAQSRFNFNDTGERRGDAVIAEMYVAWAENAIAAGQWTLARSALERAFDFADVSSDVSFLLALTLSHLNEDRGSILQALYHAFRTGMWNRYNEADARLLETEQLIALRRYHEALSSIAAGRAALDGALSVTGGEHAEFAMLRLTALRAMASGTRDATAAAEEFRRSISEALELYPRDPRPLRLFLGYARNRQPSEESLALMDIVLQRLPFLLETDNELAVLAAPFIADTDEARRRIAAYRAAGAPSKASIVPALNLGLLDDFDAIEELFASVPDTETVLDRDLISDVHDLLRSNEGRDGLARALLSFTGVITADDDRDGISESRAFFRQGLLQEFHYDADQDGVAEIVMFFDSNIPQWAEIAALPAALSAGPPAPFPLHAPPSPPSPIFVVWERYPFVQRVVLGEETFLFAPGSFAFAPIIFQEFGASGGFGGLLLPRINLGSPGITRRMLVSSAFIVQRPCAEFEGGVEQVYLRQGVVVRADVTLNGRIVSVTDFENGRPVIQRVDMDLDGSLETIRRF